MSHGAKNIKSKQTLEPSNNNNNNNNNQNESNQQQSNQNQQQTNRRKYSTSSSSSAKQRFADCALIEIIHLHDCLRGALVQIQDDVHILVESSVAIHKDGSTSTGATTSAPTSASASASTSVSSTGASFYSTCTKKSSSTIPSSNKNNDDDVNPPPSSSTSSFDIEKASDIANSIASRFHLVWSVFQAHSGAEDEFIWPALKVKIHSKKAANSNVSPTAAVAKSSQVAKSISTSTSTAPKGKKCGCESIFEHEEYEEDHEIEQTMFKQIETTLRRLQGSFRLHAHVIQQQKQNNNKNSSSSSSSSSTTIQTDEASCLTIIKNVIHQLKDQIKHLIQHLLQHLEKEETQCLPMVQRHLSNEEISNLVGNIMGQRSADVMTKILNLAVCSLPTEERQDMVKHMKKAMVGTFFEKWLSLGGWEEHQLLEQSSSSQHKINNIHLFSNGSNSSSSSSSFSTIATTSTTAAATTSSNNTNNINNNDNICDKQNKSDNGNETTCNNSEIITTSTSNNNTTCTNVQNDTSTGSDTTSFDSPVKRPREVDQDSDEMDLPPTKRAAKHHNDSRLRFPSKYYVKKKKSKKVSMIWSSENADSSKEDTCKVIPQFTISELTPTYHFNEKTGGMVLGCNHYMRGCKLRHPKTGDLFTCRLCCDEVRQSYRYRDEVLPQLDRYNVKEVMCMKCGSLQPVGKSCINKNCEAYEKPFAKHFCSICHLYDDSGTDIYHCPYCNVCRKGKGLGIDFRHCMRCNACVSIGEPHKCIPQRLQGNCPICHDAMFESTEPLRGLKCGHVMHLSCFNEYMSRASLGKLTCPLCKVSFDNMRG